ncbi:CKLF-like MARVEL transmembrane domain-containing protein 6 [Chelonia mydas]|uniref:CKLF-like MARVEL transmembrane domain-containing protein 6 n=1 Tax=Chelonia mydas TaxID=8469 RepID=UPI001CAA0173|nr:CKLF-like MARVEL transmembrane domain-containing protein 6 [Chelonia mydas]
MLLGKTPLSTGQGAQAPQAPRGGHRGRDGDFNAGRGFPEARGWESREAARPGRCRIRAFPRRRRDVPAPWWPAGGAARPLGFVWPQLGLPEPAPPAMDNGAVYNQTTELQREPQSKPCACACTLHRLTLQRLLLKAAQALLSLLAFILEEIVESCILCGGLYFFEFISFSATFLSILILTVYCTSAYEKVEKDKLIKLDFWVTTVVGVLFFVASIVFAATSDKSSVETVAIVFGFLASIGFLADGIHFFMENRKVKENKVENTGNTQNTPENQPLNN